MAGSPDANLRAGDRCTNRSRDASERKTKQNADAADGQADREMVCKWHHGDKREGKPDSSRLGTSWSMPVPPENRFDVMAYARDPVSMKGPSSASPPLFLLHLSLSLSLLSISNPRRRLLSPVPLFLHAVKQVFQKQLERV
ncbi:hypothetical protein HJFPF1_06374 [Paramyrothecium foliicola]|nr:hypothetical protein HJFPF1_06374 [Paramyrothecium foliicola]